MAAGRQIAPRKAVVPDGLLSPGEYARIQEARARAADRVAALRNDLADLEATLMGRSAATRIAAERPKVTLYRSLLSQALRAPLPSSEMSVTEILSQLAQYGLAQRSFDQVVPVTAPNPINDTGNSYDAGAVYDAWILNPSCDTKFDFNKAPNQNTPYISANSRMAFQIRAQKVWYLANSSGLTGTLQIWLLKYRGT